MEAQVPLQVMYFMWGEVNFSSSAKLHTNHLYVLHYATLFAIEILYLVIHLNFSKQIKNLIPQYTIVIFH